MAPFLVPALVMGLGAPLAWSLLRRKRVPRVPHGVPAVLEHGAMGACLVQDRVIRWANARCGEILGVDPGTLAGVSFRAFHQDEDAFRRFGENVLAACEGGETFRGDVQLRRMDGMPFWAYMAGSLMVPGQPGEGMLWFLEDVTARVEAQVDLAEVLSLNQKLIASSPTGVLLYQAADGACILANDAAARIISASPQELLKQNFRRLQSWKESGLREAADQTLATGLEQVKECHFTTSFGREVWLVATFVPFTSRGERLLLLLADDVTEAVKASAALRASEEKYRVVVETLNEGLALVDTAGIFLFGNGRLMEMGGLTLEEMVGLHISEFINPPDLPGLLERRLLARPVASEAFEIGLLRKDGTVMEAWISVASVLDGAGTPVALAVLVTDISSSRKIERERERLLAELELKNRELETLLYVASHDLRSPLVNIQGFSQRLGRSLEEIRGALARAGTLEDLKAAVAPLLQERMPASLEFIRASGVRMDSIINGLLTLSRAGRMALKAETLDMNGILKACAATLAFQFQSADGSLDVGDLPPCRADSIQVTQIVANLLDNAVKYRHPDRPLRVRVSGGVEGGTCVYVIEDNGLGIAREHRDRIWGIFQRLDPQGPVQGEGLGLTLVRRMAERNGGSIRLEEGAGLGCRFRLELPAGS